MVGRLFALLLLSALAPTAYAMGQSLAPAPAYTDEFDAAFNENYSASYWVNCIQVSTELLRPNCFGDRNEAKAIRDETKATDRWLRAGVLTATSLWAQYQQAKSLFEGTQRIARQVKSLLSGWNPNEPEWTLFRVAAATDQLRGLLEAQAEAQNKFNWNDELGRYGMVGDVVAAALTTAEKATGAAADISNQTVAGAMKLDPNARFTIHTVGDSNDGAYFKSLPALAIDAPPTPSPLYAVSGDLQRVSGSRPARSAGTGPMTSAGSELCAALVDDDPAQVVFERFAAQAKGAQITAASVRQDVRAAQTEVRAVADREKEEERISRYNLIYRFLRMF
jgi:hypothetical protein